MKMLMIDTEWTCWSKGQTRSNELEIIQIGISRVDFGKNIAAEPTEYLVRPANLDISEFCTKLTGITADMLRKHGRPLREVIGTIRNHYAMSIAWGSWGSDQVGLRNECDAKYIPYPFNENHINFGILYTLFKRPVKRTKLIDAMREYGLDFIGQQHSAGADAHNLGRLALKMFENYPLK